METLAQLRTRVYDLIDSDPSDPFHPPAMVTTALNDALIETADRLCATVARHRYLEFTPDLSADADFSDYVWDLPASFRRPFKLERDGTTITEVRAPEEFFAVGKDHYLVVGRHLNLTPGTDSTGLRVWWFYTPARMVADSDKPDFIEGYEEFLALRAAIKREIKADTGDAQKLEREAGTVWADLIMAARASALPSTIRKDRRVNGEDWY